MRRKWCGIAVAAIALAFGYSASAQPPGGADGDLVAENGLEDFAERAASTEREKTWLLEQGRAALESFKRDAAPELERAAMESGAPTSREAEVLESIDRTIEAELPNADPTTKLLAKQTLLLYGRLADRSVEATRKAVQDAPCCGDDAIELAPSEVDDADLVDGDSRQGPTYLADEDDFLMSDPQYAKNREIQFANLGRSTAMIDGVRFESDGSVDRVVGPGAVDVAPGEFDDCVAIGQRRGSSGFSGCGTGTLIGPNVVLTAGHCIDDRKCPLPTCIFVGSSVNAVADGDIYDVGKSRSGSYLRFRHKDYKTNRHTDLGLLILEDEVDGVQPRRIASSTVAQRALRSRSTVHVAGFGSTSFTGAGSLSDKMRVDVAIAPGACRFENQVLCASSFEFIAQSRVVMDGQAARGNDSCNGDSGGPVYATDLDGDEEWFLVGVTSRGVPKRNGNACGRGGVYVRPDQFRAWIEEKIQSTSRISNIRPRLATDRNDTGPEDWERSIDRAPKPNVASPEKEELLEGGMPGAGMPTPAPRTNGASPNTNVRVPAESGATPQN